MGKRPFAVLVLPLVLIAGVLSTGTASAAAVRTVKLDSVRTVNQHTGALRATGRISPAPPDGTTVYLQAYLGASAGWRAIGAGESDGSTVSIGARMPGSVLYYRLAVAPAGPYAASASLKRWHQHFVWRGVFRKPTLARGGTTGWKFHVIPPNEVPAQSEAELLSGPRGVVWGDLNTSGCVQIRDWMANLTEGTVRISLKKGSTVLGAIDMRQETEAILIRDLAGATRTRLDVRDLGSTYGPTLSIDTYALCNN